MLPPMLRAFPQIVSKPESVDGGLRSIHIPLCTKNLSLTVLSLLHIPGKCLTSHYSTLMLPGMFSLPVSCAICLLTWQQKAIIPACLRTSRRKSLKRLQPESSQTYRTTGSSFIARRSFLSLLLITRIQHQSLFTFRLPDLIIQHLYRSLGLSALRDSRSACAYLALSRSVQELCEVCNSPTSR